WVCCFFAFFFSSRRRHTRSKRDWSSDVCSSDLQRQALLQDKLHCAYTHRLNSRVNRLFCKHFFICDIKNHSILRINQAFRPNTRSEERRVGKACKSRRWEDAALKKKMSALPYTS